MMPLDLTIAIPVRNEEQNLEGCLAAIGRDFVKNIVLIDSGSTDKTVDIAVRFGIEVISFEWNGRFPKKRNWYLRSHPPKTKWVLFLDADEYLTPAFKEELAIAIQDSQKAGFWLRYTVHFMGKRLKGGYPMKKLALFRVGTGEYEQIDEADWSQLDMEIHEHPVLNGPLGEIKSKIDHRDIRDLNHYIAKHNEYSSWEARRFVNRAGVNVWTWKQQLKYSLVRSVFIGPFYFLGSYVLFGGFRDGMRGLLFALFKMNYFTQIYAKIRELEGASK